MIFKEEPRRSKPVGSIVAGSGAGCVGRINSSMTGMAVGHHPWDVDHEVPPPAGSDCHVMPAKGEASRCVTAFCSEGGVTMTAPALYDRIFRSSNWPFRFALAVVLVGTTFVVAILSNWLIHRRYATTMES